MPNILVIPDTHFGYACKKAFKTFYDTIRKMEAVTPFSHVVQVGDLYELYNISRFPKSMNLTTPAEEIKIARESAETMWANVRSICKKAKLYQIKGNHCNRIHKLIVDRLPELSDLIDFNHLWHFKSVLTLDDIRDELIIKCGKSQVVFMHGYKTKLGDHMAHNLENTACGHSHAGGTVFKRHKDRILWELNAGCLADLESRPLQYTPQKKYHKHMNGFGVIDDFGPRFIPIINGDLWIK